VIVGCSGGGKDAANSVSGKVQYKGQDVQGMVVFVSGSGEFQGPILGGKYKVDNPPKGEVTVLVRGLGPGAMPGGLKAPPGATGAGKDAAPGKTLDAGGAGGVQPPAKYADAKTSDLKFTVTGGKQTYDIELK